MSVYEMLVFVQVARVPTRVRNSSGGIEVVPEGPRVVATGAAQLGASRVKRNPWQQPGAPLGRTDAPPNLSHTRPANGRRSRLNGTASLRYNPTHTARAPARRCGLLGLDKPNQ